MKKFEYKQYDYSFLYGILTENQRKSLQEVLNRFIGCPNTEMTRYEIKYAVEGWLRMNNIELTGHMKLELE